MKKIFPLAIATAMATTSSFTFADDVKITELQEQINALADMLESQSVKQSDTTLGAYGEMHYLNYNNAPAKLNFHRYILFVGHQFDEKTRFFSELEIEHSVVGASSPKGAVELEQAYLQFDTSSNSIVTAGIFVLPVGLINETHEPPVFYGVERNPIAKNIIPTTWAEGGAMYSSNSSSGLSYDVAIHSGLNATTTASTTSAPITTNIRKARQKISNAVADTLAYTGRVKYTGITGLELSMSANIQTNLDQGIVKTGATPLGAATMLQSHAIYSTGNLKLVALVANWAIDGAADTSGSYLEASYKINPKMGIFARQNAWNVGTGDKTQFNSGVSYWPHEDVVLKFDLQQQNVKAGSSNGFNMGIGYQF